MNSSVPKVTLPHELTERRSGRDRRGTPKFPPAFSPQRRRRSAGRRADDPGGYVDVYDRWSWTVAASVLLLSFLDAVFTILHLQAGHVREANPLLERILEFGGVYTFFSVKCAMTAFALAVIMLHKEWRLARFAVHAALISYGLVTAYHAYLLVIL